MQREKGITMISLVIMIVIMAILVGTAVYSGTQSLQEAKKTRFITELRMVQEKIRLSEYSVENGNMIGKDYTGLSNEKREKILASEGIGITDFNGYRYLTKEELEKNLQLSGTMRNVLINFATKDVISEQGIKVAGKWCYTLRQVGVDDYVTTYDESQMQNTIKFDIVRRHIPDDKRVRDKWSVSLSNIVVTDYPQKYQAYYRVYDDRQGSNENWRLMKKNEAIIEGGEYEFKIVDSYGNQKIQKERFSYFPPLGGSLIYKVGSLEDGYVATDDNENEYVWIPVDGIYGEDGTDTTKQVLLGRYDFDENGKATPYTGECKEETIKEHASSGYTNANAKDIEGFIESVKKNNGYYIARYEASQGKDGKAESKRNKDTWNNTQLEASKACQNLLSGFSSDLVNSYAWDTAILFIQQNGQSNNYANQPGENTEVKILKTGNSILKSTNLLDEQCHIFDMAGNCWEFSTETYPSKAAPVTVRGGNYADIYFGTKLRFYDETDRWDSTYSFRSILYLL